MKNDELVRQLRTILDDQQRELGDVRAKRKQTLTEISGLDAKEIELILSIQRTKQQLKDQGAVI